MRPQRKFKIMMVETTHAFIKLKQIKAAVSAGGINLCLCKIKTIGQIWGRANEAAKVTESKVRESSERM